MKRTEKSASFVAIITLAFLVFFISGCGGSSSGSAANPADLDGGASQTSISIQALDSAPNAAASKQDATDATGGLVTVTSAIVSVDKIELESIDGRTCEDLPDDLSGCSCISSSSPSIAKSSNGTVEPEDASDDNEIHVAGPIVVDLIAGTSNPPIDSLAIPSGVYHEIQLKVTPLDPLSTLVAADDPLLGNSLVIDGTYVANLVSQLFRIVLNFDHEIKFESDTGVSVQESTQINQLILSLDLNSWFTDIDLAACFASGAVAPDAQGVIIIDPSVTEATCQFEDVLKENIELSSQLSESESENGS